MIDQAAHDVAQEFFIRSNSCKLSLVDCSSIAYMRSTGITRAFTFDSDFERSDIEVLS